LGADGEGKGEKYWFQVPPGDEKETERSMGWEGKEGDGTEYLRTRESKKTKIV